MSHSTLTGTRSISCATVPDLSSKEKRELESLRDRRYAAMKRLKTEKFSELPPHIRQHIINMASSMAALVEITSISQGPCPRENELLQKQAYMNNGTNQCESKRSSDSADPYQMGLSIDELQDIHSSQCFEEVIKDNK